MRPGHTSPLRFNRKKRKPRIGDTNLLTLHIEPNHRQRQNFFVTDTDLKHPWCTPVTVSRIEVLHTTTTQPTKGFTECYLTVINHWFLLPEETATRHS